MKNLIKNTVMMIVALLVSASCNDNNSVRQKKDAQSETASQDKTMKSDGKVLIVFFSHAGENYGVGTVLPSALAWQQTDGWRKRVLPEG